MTAVVDPALVSPAVRDRSSADLFMRSLLRVPEKRPTRQQRDVHGIFSLSIAISALRCTLTYLILPLVAPIVGGATAAAPVIGVPVSIVALIFDVRGVRRFWLADHKQRWPMTFVYAAVMVMVTIFLTLDLIHLAT